MAQGYRTGMAKRIWLLLCEQGGRWAPEEVAAVLGVKRQSAALTLHNMHNRRLLVRAKVRGRAQFGVTASCTIPSGVTVRELIQAQGGGQ